MDKITASENRKLRLALSITLAILIILLFFLCWLIARDYRRANALEQAEHFQSFLSTARQHGPLGRADVGDITSWMTFDYINYLFNLPPSYLKTTVPIIDPVYPHLSLNSYARYTHEQRTSLVTAVQESVSAYILAHTASSTP